MDVKDMSSEQLDQALATEQASYNKLVRQLRKLNREHTAALRRLETLRVARVERTIEDLTPTQALRLMVDDEIPYGPVYERLSKQVEAELAGRLPADSFYRWDLFENGEQAYPTPKLTPPHGTDSDAWASALTDLLTDWQAEFEFPQQVTFSVMSNDLSARGVVELDYDRSSKTARVLITSFGHQRIEFEGTLSAALAHLSLQHNYGEPFPPSYDDL